MFGVSFFELIVIFLIALLVFGPDKLPELTRNFGRFMAQFRRQSDSIRREFYNTVYKPADDFKSSIRREARNLMSEPVPPPQPKEEIQVCQEPKPNPPDETKEEPPQ